jgi:hypothetical protein
MVKARGPEDVWYAREYWSGDSRDGQYANGDGYHYFELKGDGHVLRAFEYYETDDGEEHAKELAELVGIHWFRFFGFEETDELLETVPEHEFAFVADLVKKSAS